MRNNRSFEELLLPNLHRLTFAGDDQKRVLFNGHVRTLP
jgi:hypothetical protein